MNQMQHCQNLTWGNLADIHLGHDQTRLASADVVAPGAEELPLLGKRLLHTACPNKPM